MNPKTTISRKITFPLIVSVILFLTACQTTPVHQAYNGPKKSDSEVASISIPESFNLLFFDKEKYHALIARDGAKIQALPGNHQIILYFKEYWDLPGDDFERVESKPISIKLNAQAGHNYNLKFNKPKNLEEARAFGKNPSIEFIDSSTGTTVSATIEYNLYTRSFFSDLFGENNTGPSDSAQTDQAPSSPSVSTQAPMAEIKTPTPPTFAPSVSYSSKTPSGKEDTRALDMLKYWWESASEEQKNSFKEWIK